MDVRGELYYAAAWLLGSEWRSRLKRIEQTPVGAIEQHALPTLLNHALTRVPYYRELGISKPELRAFPLLSRETLRSRYEHLQSDDLEKHRVRRVSTGGSTGEPVWVLQDRNFVHWDYATDMYYRAALCGMPYHEYLRSRRVAIWHTRRRTPGTTPIKRLAVRLLSRLATIEPYTILSNEQMNEYLRRINRHRPTVILTFAGTAFELAKHAMRTGVKMHRPKLIISSVEMLYPPMREVIEEVFGCPVCNMYGSAEVGRVAAECREGKLHLFSFANRVEVLNNNGSPTTPGEIGRVIVTPLHNHAMPLIRYDIGDLARVSSEPCTCGNPLPTIDGITGRVIHHFVRPDGALVFGGNFVAMFYEHGWISQMHVLQEDVDRIKVSYRRTPGCQIPGGCLDTLTRTVREVMGTDCAVVWEEVDVIPHSPIGKHLHVRSIPWEERAKVEDKL